MGVGHQKMSFLYTAEWRTYVTNKTLYIGDAQLFTSVLQCQIYEGKSATYVVNSHFLVDLCYKALNMVLWPCTTFGLLEQEVTIFG